jgi:rRNA-processing protein FCF1
MYVYHQHIHNCINMIYLGISKSKFCVFTTSSAVNNELRNEGVKVIYLDKLKDVGKVGASDVGAKFRFLYMSICICVYILI